MSKPGPLSGVRVLELGSTIAGPFCGRLLADFGADVIKVEDPAGDTLRTFGQSVEGKSLYAASLFRNKSMVALDLRQDEGRRAVRDLALKCQVVVENFKPGALESWGLGYDTLAAENPALVMVRISGFGQTGPYRERPGYGVIGEAVSGLRYINGDPGHPPARMATALTDYITGLYAAFGAVMAIMNARVTGRGQCVDAALSECAFTFMDPYVPGYEKLGIVPERTGSRLPGAAPNDIYPTREGKFVLIAAFSEAIFRRLCRAMDRADLAEDPRFATLTARNENVEPLNAEIAAWTGARPLDEIERVLGAADVPASRIFTMADIFADPHFAARSMLVPTPDEELGEITLAAPVPHLGDTPATIRHSGRRIGQDTRRILGEVAGYDGARIDDLAARGIVRTDAGAEEGSGRHG
jgi:crotonobetainyl-CoA:carnitine CoA-transferase CaiB-like acyl-CoA transferase